MQTNVSLRDYTTMRLGGNAAYMIDVATTSELQAVYQDAAKTKRATFVLGGGSNTIVHDEGFAGIVIRNRIKGFDIYDDSPETVTIRVGAGEDWDETVARTVDMGLTGIEALSAIPGTVGGAPVQNIGAYGQEIADTIVSVQVYDTSEDRFETLLKNDLGLGYRHSIFRGSASGRYVITAVTLSLRRQNPEPPFYAAVESYFQAHDITTYTPAAIRSAVIDIRANKLPDPGVLPNAGSFFKNAVIDNETFERIRANFPDVPSYDAPNNSHKIPTGWLIEQTGLKGQLLHGIRVHDKNALVLINESAKNYTDLANARDEIIAKVYGMFSIKIEQEPLEL